MLKQQKGITLLSLVFIIIVMLVLAAIAIAMVLDELNYNPEPVQVENEKQVVSTESPVMEPTTESTPVTNE